MKTLIKDFIELTIIFLIFFSSVALGMAFLMWEVTPLMNYLSIFWLVVRASMVLSGLLCILFILLE